MISSERLPLSIRLWKLDTVESTDSKLLFLFVKFLTSAWCVTNASARILGRAELKARYSYLSE